MDKEHDKKINGYRMSNRANSHSLKKKKII